MAEEKGCFQTFLHNPRQREVDRTRRNSISYIPIPVSSVSHGLKVSSWPACLPSSAMLLPPPTLYVWLLLFSALILLLCDVARKKSCCLSF